jgi:hypothetical protein
MLHAQLHVEELIAATAELTAAAVPLNLSSHPSNMIAWKVPPGVLVVMDVG